MANTKKTPVKKNTYFCVEIWHDGFEHMDTARVTTFEEALKQFSESAENWSTETKYAIIKYEDLQLFKVRHTTISFEPVEK